MNRRMSLFALLLCLMIAIAGTASAAPQITVTPLTPVKDTVVSTTELHFTWRAVGAEKFKFVLQNTDGTQKFVIKTLTAQGSCNNNVCFFMLNPMIHAWDWREDATYTWKVVAMNANGKKLGVGKSNFSTNFMPELTTTAPVDNAPPTLDYVMFNWPDSPEVNHYRLVIKTPSGAKIVTAWLNRYNVCGSGTCSYIQNFLITGSGKYKWHLEASRNDVLDIVKSAKKTFNVGFGL